MAAFYDGLAEDYPAIFADWDASVRRQGEIIDRLIQAAIPGAARILDATCGIGTQAIGLALHGYEVAAADLSAASIERAGLEAARLGAAVAFAVADIRELAEHVPGSFDVAISFDNALPHLVAEADLKAAMSNLLAVLRPNGLLLASMRDYDAVLDRRPSGEAPRMSGAPGARRLTTQAWEWEADRPVYRLHQFVLREQPDGRWMARHLETRYRALRRHDLAAVAEAAGFGDVRWLEPSETGYYQPILIARRP